MNWWNRFEQIRWEGEAVKSLFVPAPASVAEKGQQETRRHSHREASSCQVDKLLGRISEIRRSEAFLPWDEG